MPKWIHLPGIIGLCMYRNYSPAKMAVLAWILSSYAVYSCRGKDINREYHRFGRKTIAAREDKRIIPENGDRAY